jgi:hypothetical protein
MNTTLVKLGACIAWTGLAISAASPANALVLTLKGGAYGVCTANYQTDSHEDCNGSFAYKQPVRFTNTSCNTGSCAETSGTTYVEVVYSYGRKPTTQYQSCNSMMLYGLGSCAC